MVIKIKESHKGLFTAKANKAGMSVGAFANKEVSSKTASPATKKQAVFAKNASNWKKG